MMKDIANSVISKKKILKRKVQEDGEVIDKKKTKLKIENDDIEENNHENDDGKMSTNELGNKITGKYIRKVLNGGGGIGILRKFVSVCNNEKDNEDLAGEYLEAKGSVLEILKLLDDAEKKNSANAAVIFSAMHIVIMKIISQYPQYMANAEEACRHFINSHLSSVHSMFSSQSIPQQRKICLRLLTAIVSLGGNLPRELLAHLSFHSQTLELLCQHTKPSDTNNVRTCFIHFIVSFLVDGSIGVIRALLDKRGMLTSIFPGLIYDKSTIVHLVLNTVKTYVLENNLVSKTTKLHLFSTPVVQSLINLYNWKGPSKWPGANPKKSKTITSSDVDPEDKRIAIEAVHEFLLLLLTSTRYGIIFNDKSLGTSGRKHNQLANSVLQCLDKPWEHDKPRELVINILSSSPDLIKSQLASMEPFMLPRLSMKWLQLMQFIQSIIQRINYESLLIINLNELTFSQLISASLTLSLPQIVLKNAITPAINNTNIVLRHEAIETLTIMLKQMQKIIEIVRSNNNCLEGNNFIEFEGIICDYIVKNSPSVRDLLRVWDKNIIESDCEVKTDGIIAEEIILRPSNINHFSAVINLLQIYRDICPEYLEEFNTISCENIKPIVLLKYLKEIEGDCNDEEEFIEVKVRAIEFILSINSDAFIGNKEFFSEGLLFLISLLNNDKYSGVNLNAIETIKLILISTDVFEGSEDQIDIWINCFKLSNNSDIIIDVGKWFVKLLRNTIKQRDEYLNKIIVAEENNLEDENINKNQLENIINELYERNSMNVNEQMIIIQPAQSIPILYCAAIENFKDNPNENVSKYLSFVTVLTLHCQINPGTIFNLINNIETLPMKYLTSWRTENGIYIKKPFDKNDLIRRFSKILLTNVEIEWENIFHSGKKLEININNKLILINCSLNNYEVSILLKMTLFYLTQSLRQLKMNNEQFERYKMSIIVLLNIGINIEDDKKLNGNYFKLIFINPILLQFFSPLSAFVNNDKNHLEMFITNDFIFNISNIIIENISLNYLELSEIFYPFKQKYLSQMELLIEKSMNGWRINDTMNLDKFIEIFQLNSRDLYNLLNKILELPNKIILSIDINSLSAWGKLIPKLIDLLLNNNEIINSEENIVIMKKLINHLAQLLTKSKANLNDWIATLNKYLYKYPQNISLIDIKLFKLYFQRELTTPTINFIGLLINRNDELIPQFIDNVTKINPKLIKNRELIFHIVSSNLIYKWDYNFLKIIFDEYRSDIVNYFTCQSIEINSWIDNNLNSLLYLINKTFDSEICENIMNNILSSGDKLDGININYIILLHCLMKKCTGINNEMNSTVPMINFIQILIRIGVCTLKKNSPNDNKQLPLICNYLCETIVNLKLNNNNFILEQINNNNSWPQFTRFSLKIGLKLLKNCESQTGKLLKTLAEICSIAYKDNSDCEHVKKIFEMTTSHSEFMNTMLGKDLNKKYELLYLIYVLVCKNYSLMLSTHIPLYLSAYNATLNKCDQMILMILQHYERQNVQLNNYKPYFWGEAASNYYSVKGEADTALWRQPSTSQVFDLFNIDIVTNTIECYPIERQLNNSELISVRNENVYDPAFYLPLIIYLLADNNVVTCNRVTQSGALSLIFAACSSSSDDMKIAAFTGLSRFYFHLQATGHKERLLWMRLIDGFKNGLSQTIKDTKISCLVSTFLAKASIISTQPLNPLFPPIQSYFMAKPALDFNIIPEFLTLFHSSEINHKINRHWILEVIKDGIKSDFDVDLALKCVLFRMLFDYYHTVLSDSTTKNLILQIVNATVQIPKSQLLLVRGYSLILWLNNVVINISNYDIINIKLIIKILQNLLNVGIKTNDRDHNLYMLLIVMKNLISKLTNNMDIDTLNNCLIILNNLSNVKLFNQVIETNHLELLINLFNKFTHINCDEYIDMLNNGCEFIDKCEFIDNNFNNNSDKVDLIKFNFKKLLFNWHNHGNVIKDD